LAQERARDADGDDMTKYLPEPTRDLATAREDLGEFGYCLVSEALSPPEVARLRDRLIEQAMGERAAGRAWIDGSGANQRVWMLVNKGQVFRDLVVHPLVKELMPVLLDKGYLLSSLTANIAGPGGEPMVLHADQGYVRMHTPVPLVANIAWMLDDFTEANGATRIIPRSHARPGIEPPEGPGIAAEAPAGTALVFDGRLWHGTGPNRTQNQQRHAILQYCCRGYIRQQENFFLGLARDVFDHESEEFLGRLGFRIWGGLGRTGDPTQKGILPYGNDEPLRALNASGTPKIEAQG